jgi:hypothetical protein
MKQFVALLLVIACLHLDAQNYADIADDKQAGVLLNKIRLQTATEQDSAALQKIAIAVQEHGQQQDEQQHDYRKSVQSIDKAIALFEALGDTLNMAFNRKYKGHLLVRLNKTAAAKAEIRAAINLYRGKNTGAGIASSQFDLARIFEFENRPDSAIYYADVARTYWQQQENNLQTIVINNLMLYQLLQLNQTEKAAAVYHESESLLKKQAPHWQPLLDYYFTAMLLFRQINDASNASHYRELYIDKIGALRREGINARSYYETFTQ